MEEYHDLRSWYSARRPLFVDLVGDFCGRELFLLDGDSLLRHILNDDNLDFQGKIGLLATYRTPIKNAAKGLTVC